jgi:hypothetical protein
LFGVSSESVAWLEHSLFAWSRNIIPVKPEYYTTKAKNIAAKFNTPKELIDRTRTLLNQEKELPIYYDKFFRCMGDIKFKPLLPEIDLGLHKESPILRKISQIGYVVYHSFFIDFLNYPYLFKYSTNSGATKIRSIVWKVFKLISDNSYYGFILNDDYDKLTGLEQTIWQLAKTVDARCDAVFNLFEKTSENDKLYVELIAYTLVLVQALCNLNNQLAIKSKPLVNQCRCHDGSIPSRRIDDWATIFKTV